MIAMGLTNLNKLGQFVPGMEAHWKIHPAFDMFQGAINIAMGILLLRPSFKTSVNVYLLKRGEQTSSAAAIAGLIGGREAADVQKIAAAKFRCVSLANVFEADMAGNAPDPALAARTQPASFGQVDAFMTHSWSDSSALKWAQLQQWRT